MKTYRQFLYEAKSSKPDALEKITGNWQRKHPGLKYHAYKTRAGHIELHSLEVPKEKRKRGIGTRIMKGLTNYASKQKEPVALTPRADKGYKGKLDKFYRSHGFKPNKGRNKDFTTTHSMIRRPNQ